MIRRLVALLASAGVVGCLGASQAVSASAGAVSTPYYGISLSELQVAPVGTATIRVAEAELQAIHDAWHANTVRLQIEQDKLTSASGSGYYWEIRSVVNYALGLGLTVVINDTTLPAPGFTSNEP